VGQHHIEVCGLGLLGESTMNHRIRIESIGENLLIVVDGSILAGQDRQAEYLRQDLAIAEWLADIRRKNEKIAA
jgi:hypothetical protein